MAMMFMSVSDEHFIDKSLEDHGQFEGDLREAKDNRLKTCTRDDMIKFLDRVMDKNKPLFVFNSKAGSQLVRDTGTPSFSMIALIEKN